MDSSIISVVICILILAAWNLQYVHGVSDDDNKSGVEKFDGNYGITVKTLNEEDVIGENGENQGKLRRSRLQVQSRDDLERKSEVKYDVQISSLKLVEEVVTETTKFETTTDALSGDGDVNSSEVITEEEEDVEMQGGGGESSNIEFFQAKDFSSKELQLDDGEKFRTTATSALGNSNRPPTTSHLFNYNYYPKENKFFPPNNPYDLHVPFYANRASIFSYVPFAFDRSNARQRVFNFHHKNSNFRRLNNERLADRTQSF